MDNVIILLTWQRPKNLASTLKQLSRQDYKDFDIHISNGHSAHKKYIEDTAKSFVDRGLLNIQVSHDGNEFSCFRRFFIARSYAEKGYKRVFFIDDDITIPRNYMQLFMDSYEPETYQSAYTWTFQNQGADYYKQRVRVYSNQYDIKYGGAGVSMVDASVFLNPGLMSPPQQAYGIDDLWISYYCDHVLNWKIKHVHIPDLAIGGGDSVALYRSIKLNQKENKATFLRQLVERGWKV